MCEGDSQVQGKGPASGQGTIPEGSDFSRSCGLGLAMGQKGCRQIAWVSCEVWYCLSQTPLVSGTVRASSTGHRARSNSSTQCLEPLDRGDLFSRYVSYPVLPGPGPKPMIIPATNRETLNKIKVRRGLLLSLSLLPW